MRNRQLLLIFAVALLAAPATALAHHGRVEYDSTSITLKGSVTEFAWTNPHCVLSVSVQDAQGASQEWHAEILPPSQMIRAGWTPSSVKVGDQVALTGRPGKKGEHIMWLEYVVTPEGRKLGRDLGAH